MKYRLDAIINGEERISKVFSNRNKANKYLDKVLDIYNLEVNEIVNTNNSKHNIEYICDGYNHISINRI